MLMMCQYRFIAYNKCPTPVGGGVLMVQEAVYVSGKSIYENSLYFLLHFAGVKPKIAFKNVYKVNFYFFF